MINTLKNNIIPMARQVMRRDSLLFFLFILGQRYNNSLKAQNFQGKMLLFLQEHEEILFFHDHIVLKVIILVL